MKTRYTIYAARALATLWVGFWLWFAVASSIDHLMSMIVAAGIPLGLSVFAVVMAWRRPQVGGAMLVIEGLTIAGTMAAGFLNPNSLATALFLILTLVVPPIVAGLLFLEGCRRGRRPVSAS